MSLSPSAHVDTFCRDNLPPEDQWPEFLRSPAELDYPDRLNCASVLLDGVIADHGADRPCLLTPDGGPAWSYGDLLATANRVAGLLVQHGIVPGNRVLLRGPNNPWLVACWFGVLKAGAVAVVTMSLLRARELEAIDEVANTDLVLCDQRFAAAVREGMPDTSIIEYGGTGEDDLASRVRQFPAEFDDIATAADDVALLAFTSGTTGKPKATVHFHRDVLAIADTFSAHIVKPHADDVFTGTPPLAFTFGLGGLVVFPLRVGASTLLIEKATPKELARHIAEHQVTVCFTAPTAYRAMLADADDVSRLRSLRRGVSAGEHLDKGTWERFEQETGLRLIDGIGATEMLHVFISAADDDIRPGATGRAVPGYQACILDDAGNAVPDGTPGRLAVKGPTGCRYLADERQTHYVQGGWNMTGDTFVRDREGYFWYQARSDDMIISSGYNIAGPEVEEAIASHPSVLECAVIGVPDTARGSIVKGYVVLAGEWVPSEELARQIQDHVKATIAPYKYPRAIEFIDALPRTQTGKVQRYRLRESVGTMPVLE